MESGLLYYILYYLYIFRPKEPSRASLNEHKRSMMIRICYQTHAGSRWRYSTPPPNGFPILLSESESYVTTDGQSTSLSWYKAPIRGLRPDFYCRTEYARRLTVTFLVPWGALSDERTGLSFVCAAGPCQRSLSRVLVPLDLQPYFTVSDLRLPFRRLLRLAGSRWRYSTPPPHGYSNPTVHSARYTGAALTA
jgi:hypothetical protein